jgi:hypothetical protein
MLRKNATASSNFSGWIGISKLTMTLIALPHSVRGRPA